MTDLTNWQAAALMQAMKDAGTWYFALHTASPGKAGSLANEVPTSGTGYARQSASGLLSAVTAEGIVTLIGTVQFPTPTANWGGGPVTHISIMTASSAGNMRAYKALPAAYQKVIGVGSPRLTFPAASISFGLT